MDRSMRRQSERALLKEAELQYERAALPQGSALTSTRFHRLLQGDGWDAVVDGRPEELRAVLTRDVAQCCGVPADSVKNVKLVIGGLHVAFDVTHSTNVSSDEMASRVDACAVEGLVVLYQNRHGERVGVDKDFADTIVLQPRIKSAAAESENAKQFSQVFPSLAPLEKGDLEQVNAELTLLSSRSLEHIKELEDHLQEVCESNRRLQKNNADLVAAVEAIQDELKNANEYQRAEVDALRMDVALAHAAAAHSSEELVRAGEAWHSAVQRMHELESQLERNLAPPVSHDTHGERAAATAARDTMSAGLSTSREQLAADVAATGITCAERETACAASVGAEEGAALRVHVAQLAAPNNSIKQARAAADAAAARSVGRVELSTERGVQLSCDGPAGRDAIRSGRLTLDEFMQIQTHVAQLEESCRVLAVQKRTVEEACATMQEQRDCESARCCELEERWRRAVDEKEQLQRRREEPSQRIQSVVSSGVYSCDEESAMFDLMQEIDALRYQCEAVQEEYSEISADDVLLRRRIEDLEKALAAAQEEVLVSNAAHLGQAGAAEQELSCRIAELEAALGAERGAACVSLEDAARSKEEPADRISELPSLVLPRHGDDVGGDDCDARRRQSSEGDERGSRVLEVETPCTGSVSQLSVRFATCDLCRKMQRKYLHLKELLAKRTRELEESQELVRQQERYLIMAGDL